MELGRSRRHRVCASVRSALLLGVVPVVVMGLAGTFVIQRVDGGARTDVSARATVEQAPTSHSYGWPVKPFFRQHAVRGLLGDPRIGPGRDGRIEHNLHFGVDVVAANGTAVYATLTGRVTIHPLHPDTVVISDGTGRHFEYWHVVPSMGSGHANAYSTVIGHVEPPWAHVHFSERIGSRYVNPLRPGAMSPYRDVKAPLIVNTRFERGGRDLGQSLTGRVDVVVEAFDTPAVRVSPPWNGVRLTPALVRWRVLETSDATPPAWSSLFDTRGELPSAPFSFVYAAGTRQNLRSSVGRYRFYLAHDWDTATLADGPHALQVSVLDIRGNSVTELVPFSAANY